MGSLWKWGIVAAVAALAVLAMMPTVCSEKDGKVAAEPFGGAADVAYAESLWDLMDGYLDWPMKSDVLVGGTPHGAFVRLYYNTLQVEGRNVHVVAKDNYGGEGATIESVSAAPADYLGAVTVMVQREPGYDPENDNWYWGKYLPDGSLDVNPAGAQLAGRVAKGAETGCIACHLAAEDADYLFSNDP